MSEKREFSITPKTTHEWILGQHHSGEGQYREHLAGDILKNAMELEPGVNWFDVLNVTWWKTPNGLCTGIAALAASVAAPIGGIARGMGWSMHTPEVVYMSGQAFVSPISFKIHQLDQSMIQIDTGVSKFPTEEDKLARLRDLKQEAGKFGVFRGRILDSVEAYADQFLPGTPNLREILRMMIRVGKGGIDSSLREKALLRLKNGDFDLAQRILKGR